MTEIINTETNNNTTPKMKSTSPLLPKLAKLLMTVFVNIKEHLQQSKIFNYLYTNLEETSRHFINVVISPFIAKIRARMVLASETNPVRRFKESLLVKVKPNGLMATFIEKTFSGCGTVYEMVTTYLSGLDLKTTIMDWISKMTALVVKTTIPNSIEVKEATSNSSEDESSETESKDVDDSGICEDDPDKKLYMDFLKGELEDYDSDEDPTFEYSTEESESLSTSEYVSEEDLEEEELELEELKQEISTDFKDLKKFGKRAVKKVAKEETEAALTASCLNEKKSC